MLGYLVSPMLFYIFVKHSRGLRLVSMYMKAGALGDSKVFSPFLGCFSLHSSRYHLSMNLS